MSYTVRFRSCNYKTADDSKRPLLTGGVGRPLVIDLGLTDAERTAVLSFLRHRGMRRLGADDRVQVKLPDGTPITVHLVGLLGPKICFDGIVVAPELSQPLAAFVFELAKAGNFLFGLENHRPFVPTIALHPVMARLFPGVQIATTAAQLWKIVGTPQAEDVPPAAAEDGEQSAE